MQRTSTASTFLPVQYTVAVTALQQYATAVLRTASEGEASSVQPGAEFLMADAALAAMTCADLLSSSTAIPMETSLGGTSSVLRYLVGHPSVDARLAALQVCILDLPYAHILFLIFLPSSG